ncbi:MAG: glycosyltransferase [Candidatus Cloacimonetes bacterium]|nr:glycosyltransferase [Candidatus Cloacimonadota bacterium]
MKRVSVVIPTYNCADYITEAVDSVLNQTYKEIEVVVIDDGSTDQTKHILSVYNDKIMYLYQENHGVAVARNKGIEVSNGDYISFLDSDNKWLPDLLADSVAILENKPDIGLVHSGKIRINENGDVIEDHSQKKGIKHLSGYIYKNLLLRKANFNLSSVVVRMKCIEEVGMFDVNLSKIGCEDRDFFIRIAKKYKIQYINKPLYLGRFRESSMSANYTNMMRGRYYIVDKYCPPHKGLNFFRNKALSAIHLQRGDSDIWKSEYESGLKEYYRSIRLFPFNITLYFRLIKTYVKILLHGGLKRKKST